MKQQEIKQGHRSGTLKQTNKGHKTRHRTKGAIDAVRKGKTNIRPVTNKNRFQLKKEERRHQASQLRQAKREEFVSKRRELGGCNSPPFLTCVIPLNTQLDPSTAMKILGNCREDSSVTSSSNGVTHISMPIFKQRFSFISPEVQNEFETLDALKVSDSVLFLTSALDTPIDDWGEKILASAIGQGLPTPIVAVMDIESLNPKKRTAEKQNIQKLISKWLPEEKVSQLDKDVDAQNIFRRIGNQKRKFLHHREKRPYMLAESYTFKPDEEGENGSLYVTGFLKGVPLSVNSLVHIPCLGDFQMSNIYSPKDPHPLEKRTHNSEKAMQTDDNLMTLLEAADPNKQESLVSENTPDPMDAEQTYPMDDEIELAQKETKMLKKKKIPEGMSDYQATWIGDSDDENFADSDNDDEDDKEFMSCEDDNESNEGNVNEDIETMTESEVGVSDDKYDQKMDAVEEMEMLEKIKAARSDQMFPDEIDTPDNIPARDRFQKYRGLESFRTSPWDPKENLPTDYARIFQFKNFEHTRKRILKESNDQDGALPGWYITIQISNIPKNTWEAYQRTSNVTSRGAMIIFGLLPHEHKMSLVNIVLRRTGINNEPIKSKERLLIQCGYRRYFVSPIFSQHTNGQKHKYERFFQPASTCVATFYAPIQYSPSSILCYKVKNSRIQLVANGCLLSCNPNRVIIKRIILSGHPMKVHKRSAVIRFMFFNRDDVLYFKPCKLRTKYGRTGHIKEPLGTHGHMKCVFDDQLKSQDTILLNLYKRVFPKFSYDECIVTDAQEMM